MLPFVTFLGKTIPTYSLWVLLGLLIGTFIIVISAPKFDVKKDDAVYASIYAVLGLIAGGKIFYLLLNPKTVIMYAQNHGLTAILQGGFIFYGGLFGTIAGAAIYCRQFRIETKNIIALLLFAAPAVHAIGRIGCLFAGCCYGTECTLPIAVPLHGKSLFPVQLLESALNLALFAFLILLIRKTDQKELVIPVYLGGYSAIRFFCEFFRGDPERGVWGPLSTSQIIGLLVFAAAILLTVRFLSNPSKSSKTKDQKNDLHSTSNSG